MSPTLVWAAMAALWSFQHFWLTPLLRDRWRAGSLREKIARAGTLTVAEKTEEFAAVAATVLAALIVAMFLFDRLALATPGLTQRMIGALAGLYGSVKELAEGYAGIITIIGTIGALLALAIAYRHAKNQILAAWQAKAEEVRKRIADNPDLLTESRNAPELQSIFAELDTLGNLLEPSSPSTDEAASNLSDNQKQVIRERMSLLFSFVIAEIARKEVSLEDSLAEGVGAEERSSTTVWTTVKTALASKQLSNDLGLVRKPLSRTVTALMLLSLIGWHSDALANSLRLNLNELRIALEADEAHRALDQAVSQQADVPATAQPPSENSAKTPSPQQATQMAARVIARQLIRVPLLRNSTLHGASGGAARRAEDELEVVRASLAGYVPDGNVTTEDKLLREAVERAPEAAVHPDEASPLERHLADTLGPDIEHFAQHQPGHFQRWAAELAVRYNTVQSPLDAQGRLMDTLLDSLFDHATPEIKGEMAHQAAGIAKSMGKESLKQWADEAGKAILANLLTDTARPELLQAMALEGDHETDSLFRALAKSREGGWRPAATGRRDAEMNEKIADLVARNHSREDGPLVAANLRGYDELFHPDFPPPPSPAVGGGGVGGFPGFHRGGGGGGRSATGFGRASVILRARGVLIGRDHAVQGIEMSDIRWEVRKAESGGLTQVHLEVQDHGRWIDLGKFEAAIVNQALRYAADRRVVATTIDPGDGEVIMRATSLHPVLTDTPLGCRIVEADRWIDWLTMGTAASRRNSELAAMRNDREANIPWRLKTEVASITHRGGTSMQCKAELAELAKDTSRIPKSAFSPSFVATLQDFIAAKEKADPASTQFLQSALRCNGASVTHGAWLGATNQDSTPIPTAWLPVDQTSQIREKERILGPDWSWMHRSPDRLGHLDFQVHVTMQKFHLGARDESDVADSDVAQLVFPERQETALRQSLLEAIPGYIRDSLQSGSYEDFTGPIEDFVLLQRLFRATLSGSMGLQIPSAKFLALEHETRPFVPRQVTIRWEPATQDDTGFRRALGNADPDAIKLFDEWMSDQGRRRRDNLPMCDSVSK